MNEIIESLYNRKSVRVYEEKAIPNEMKNVILEAAMQAPTAVIYNFGYYRSKFKRSTCRKLRPPAIYCKGTDGSGVLCRL